MKRYLTGLAVLLLLGGALYAVFALPGGGRVDGASSVQATSVESVVRSDASSTKEKRANLFVSVQGTETVLHGTWERTSLAGEIHGHTPMEMRLVNWHGREFYGSLGWQPKGTGEGHRTFEEGDVTYCPQNNSIAIFYDKSREPDLTMDVIVIGHIDAEDIGKLHALGGEITVLLE